MKCNNCVKIMCPDRDTGECNYGKITYLEWGLIDVPIRKEWEKENEI